ALPGALRRGVRLRPHRPVLPPPTAGPRPAAGASAGLTAGARTDLPRSPGDLPWGRFSAARCHRLVPGQDFPFFSSFSPALSGLVPFIVGVETNRGITEQPRGAGGVASVGTGRGPGSPGPAAGDLPRLPALPGRSTGRPPAPGQGRPVR